MSGVSHQPAIGQGRLRQIAENLIGAVNSGGGKISLSGVSDDRKTSSKYPVEVLLEKHYVSN
jgi:hypothetical protein